jgi:hypothetical protein
MTPVPKVSFFLEDFKVPKYPYEIFDHSDFLNFYTIKPFWVGDFGAKIYIIILIFGGAS